MWDEGFIIFYVKIKKIGVLQMKEIGFKDISEKMTFRRAGYDYKNIVFDAEHHCGIWKMSKEIDGVVKDMGYEVVKGIKRTNLDDSIVYVYPGDEQFGVYGFFSYKLERCREIFDCWVVVKD